MTRLEKSTKDKVNYNDYLEQIKENVDYDFIVNLENRQIKAGDEKRVEEIVDVMVDMLYPEKPVVKIGKDKYPHEVVKSRLYKITADHVVYIIDCMDRNTSQIGAFSGCTGLTSLIIPDSVVEIGGGAFSNCDNIEDVIIGSGIDDVQMFNFIQYSFSGVIRFTVSEDNNFISSVDGVVYNKDKTAILAFPRGFQGAFTIPDSVTSIGAFAFQNCKGLTSIVIPDSVTTIRINAFSSCTGLASIIIPESVTSIGSGGGNNGAFFDCSETFTAVYKGVSYSTIRSTSVNYGQIIFDLPPEFYAAINNQ
jgi:hypothetical protein